MQRVLKALSFEEPDRVPLFLMLSLHGARELGLGIRDYFSRSENIVEAQLRMQERYRHDCLYGFFYAPIEVEAWGAEVIYSDNGPPNSGEPMLSRLEDIHRMEAPVVAESPCLLKVLRAVEGMKERVGDEIPIIGVVMSPFSLPVMQLGFARYIDLIYERPDLFEHLIRVNEAFCVKWANAQLTAGATAICYFDPVSSSTIMPPEKVRETGFPIATKTISQLNGPAATHLASGRILPILDDLVATGTAVVGVSAEEDLREVKDAAAGRVSILGNLNGIEMRRWTEDMATSKVREAIIKAGKGGGFILSDNHGEIPWQVSEEVLGVISDTVRTEGVYPLL
jgi:uroporphyrinogen decarboxylase